jgi:hypothetical protein
MRRALFFALLLSMALQLLAQREKTTFQTLSPWKPSTDIRSDVVMVYGVGSSPTLSFHDRVKSWRNRGYTTHFMTGISWGGFRDYFSGQWDGELHNDEVQRRSSGEDIMHSPNVPYVVPTHSFMAYFKEKHIKPVIDEGMNTLFFEEPEFWVWSGYSEAFKREWQDYYGFPWQPQHESAEYTYLSNKLKHHLYCRALDEAFAYAKQYGRERDMEVRCFVPTHSMLNYAQWGVVSPEASLNAMENCDGYIAQVWTGTSRMPNHYNGVLKERVFEMAFLEYGCLESMARPMGRKMFFLADPIEDRVVNWEDYKRNYQATFTAQLLYPTIVDYEVMPWPERIYEREYPISANSEEKVCIPRSYSTQMQVMINALNEIPASENHVNGVQGISVLLSNSIMFHQPFEGFEDPYLVNFFGLAMPLIKRGIPIGITHMENLGYEETLRDMRVMLMTYANMKPLDLKAHQRIADWVEQGGSLIYCGRDDDPFQTVSEWWNTNGNRFSAPSQHLFALMDMDEQAVEGQYSFGNGHIYVLRRNPQEFVQTEGADSLLLQTLEAVYGPYEQQNYFLLRRDPYLIASVVDESPVSSEPLSLKGSFIDLFDPSLPIVGEKVVQPGEQTFLYDLDKVADKTSPKVLVAASRQYEEVTTPNSYSFTSKSPAHTSNVLRVLLPKKPIKVQTSVASSSTWDEESQTLLLGFENDPEGVQVRIEW